MGGLLFGFCLKITLQQPAVTAPDVQGPGGTVRGCHSSVLFEETHVVLVHTDQGVAACAQPPRKCWMQLVTWLCRAPRAELMQ